MNLSDFDLSTLEQYAISAAYQAGHLIEREKLNRDFKVEHKQGASSIASEVVTHIDRLSQERILSVLKQSIDYYNLGLLAEESEDDSSRLVKDYFWCIDPLDGTLPFIEGKSGYSVSIALVSKMGVPIIGVIYDPVSMKMYSAVQGRGALLNGQKWLLESHCSKSVLTFYSDRSFLNTNRFEELIRTLQNQVSCIGFKDVEVKANAGGALLAMWTAENSGSCYFKFPKEAKGGGSYWDFAASACIFTELGAHVSDIDLEALSFSDKNSIFMNKTGVLYSHNSSTAKLISKIYQQW